MYIVVSQSRSGGASGTTQTSSFAGYFSSSAFPNQQQYTRPFAISTLTQVNDSNPAFVVNKNIDHPSESKFSVDYGGNVVLPVIVIVSVELSPIAAKFDTDKSANDPDKPITSPLELILPDAVI